MLSVSHFLKKYSIKIEQCQFLSKNMNAFILKIEFDIGGGWLLSNIWSEFFFKFEVVYPMWAPLKNILNIPLKLIWTPKYQNINFSDSDNRVQTIEFSLLKWRQLYDDSLTRHFYDVIFWGDHIPITSVLCTKF